MNRTEPHAVARQHAGDRVLAVNGGRFTWKLGMCQIVLLDFSRPRTIVHRNDLRGQLMGAGEWSIGKSLGYHSDLLLTVALGRVDWRLDVRRRREHA